MCSISCGLKIATITLLLAANSMVALTTHSCADVLIKQDEPDDLSLYIVGTISKSDVDYVIQYEKERGLRGLSVYLNSQGGDVEAAIKIGQIIRENERTVEVSTNSKCFSSCTLIYIAGVRRYNFGVIGLHRPYFSSAPLSRQVIEREVPLMLQKIKDYVYSMGVTDLFYQEMVNTDPSNIRLYRGEDIDKLVPQTDPTYDEIVTSYEARKYGIDTAVMRQRQTEAAEKCATLLLGDDLHEGD